MAGNDNDAFVIPAGLAFARRSRNGRTSISTPPTSAIRASPVPIWPRAPSGVGLPASPVGNPYTAGLPADVALHLQTVAWETAQAFHAREGRGSLSTRRIAGRRRAMLANRAAGFAERDSATGQFLRAADAPRPAAFLYRRATNAACSLDSVDPDTGRQRRGAPGRRQTTSSDPAPTAGPGQRAPSNLLDQLVVVGIALADDVDLAFAADGIDLPSRAVEKEIVRVGTESAARPMRLPFSVS